MNDVQKSFKDRLTPVIAPLLLKWIIVLIGLTCRKKWVGAENLDDLKKNNKNWIYSTWHNNILLDALVLKNQNLISMTSASKDGRIAARLLELMGNKTVSGSSSRGSVKVLLSMIKEVRAGQNGAITPDGPRGPRYQLQAGVITISQKTDAPLVPLHVECSKQWIFHKSWDKHKFPKPFSTIVISVGKPFKVPSKTSAQEFEIIRNTFETEMMNNVFKTETIVKNLRESNEI